MASCAASSRRSAPVAATSAMAMAIEVSSVHSPAFQGPPPAMTTSTGAAGRLELVRCAQRIAGCRAQQDTFDSIMQ